MKKMYNKNFKLIIYPIIVVSLIWSNPNNLIGETLTYEAGFRFFPIGEAELFFSTDTLDGYPFYILRSTVRTNSFLNAIYKVQDEIQSWLNPENLSLKKTMKSIQEGNYSLEHKVVINDDTAVWGKNSRKLPGKVYDPVAFVYYLRTQNLDLGNTYRFFPYSHKKIKEVIVNITKREKIQISFGTFTCLKVEPVSSDGEPILKNNGEMRVWLSDDSLKIPIIIEQKTNIGTMVMKLKEIKHFSN